jgi:hypothetical protein
MYEEEDAEAFLTKLRLVTFAIGWGNFAFFITIPVVFLGMIPFGADILLIWAILLFVFTGIVLVWEAKVKKSRFGFWIDSNKLFASYFKTMYPIMLGAIASAAMLWMLVPMVTHSSILDSENLIFNVMFIQFIVIFIILHFVSRYRLKKERGKRLRYVRGKKEDVEDIVRRSLDSQGIQYRKDVEGSKWTLLLPTYRIEGTGISIQPVQAGMKVVSLIMKVPNPEDFQTSREIERVIDSFLRTAS